MWRGGQDVKRRRTRAAAAAAAAPEPLGPVPAACPPARPPARPWRGFPRTRLPRLPPARSGPCRPAASWGGREGGSAGQHPRSPGRLRRHCHVPSSCRSLTLPPVLAVHAQHPPLVCFCLRTMGTSYRLTGLRSLQALRHRRPQQGGGRRRRRATPVLLLPPFAEREASLVV